MRGKEATRKAEEKKGEVDHKIPAGNKVEGTQENINSSTFQLKNMCQINLFFSGTNKPL